MKKNSILAIIAMAILATTVAVVSCKKEESKSVSNKDTLEKTFDPMQIEDMNNYLEGFKQRMLSTSKDNNEVFSLEEAEWHLTSLANYDFGYANVDFDDIRFDTLFDQANVIDGTIGMNDIATTYESINNRIDKFFHSLMLDNKHFRLINVEISERGEVTISIITTFSNAGKLHYFSDSTFCDQYFTQASYPANGSAVSTLTNLFNLILGKNTDPDEGRTYYVITRNNVPFYFDQWYEDPDEYCPNSEHSRLYCSIYAYDWPIPKYQMCYYLDSYSGLATVFGNNISLSVVDGHVEFHDASGVGDGGLLPQWGNHALIVDFGIAVGIHDPHIFDY